MADSQVPLGLAAATTELTSAGWKNKKSWYIVSKKDKMIPPDAERMMAKGAGATFTEMDASHAVYISRAAEVAAIIEKAAPDMGHASSPVINIFVDCFAPFSL